MSKTWVNPGLTSRVIITMTSALQSGIIYGASRRGPGSPPPPRHNDISAPEGVLLDEERGKADIRGRSQTQPKLQRISYIRNIFIILHISHMSRISPVFEIKVLFCAPLVCIHIETVRPGFSSCTPLVYCNYNIMNTHALIGRTPPKNMRPAAKMCAPCAECTVNFDHCE